MSNIKLAIFDLDGTLIDSVKVHSEAWHNSCKSFGYNIPESYFYNLTGMTSKSVGEKLLKDFGIPENCIDDLIQYKSKLYFDNINKIVVFGAVYLGVVALLPIIAGDLMSGFNSLAIGGTSVIIVVGVALETVKALEAQMLMRHYKGFLD